MLELFLNKMLRKL